MEERGFGGLRYDKPRFSFPFYVFQFSAFIFPFYFGTTVFGTVLQFLSLTISIGAPPVHTRRTAHLPRPPPHVQTNRAAIRELLTHYISAKHDPESGSDLDFISLDYPRFAVAYQKILNPSLPYRLALPQHPPSHGSLVFSLVRRYRGVQAYLYYRNRHFLSGGV